MLLADERETPGGIVWRGIPAAEDMQVLDAGDAVEDISSAEETADEEGCVEEGVEPAAQRVFTLTEAALFMNQHPIDGGEMACVRGNGRPLPGGVVEGVIRKHLPGELAPDVAVRMWWSLGPAASAEAAVRAILVADAEARDLDFADPSQCQLRIKPVEDADCGSGSIVFVKMACPPE